ncbi:DUF892 family protein [Planosporangium thailandense]|uniref:DUF892 family protein n=1 Tax=Planosporangium thailandense TaxID=765197 RepID=A0ABX0Y3G7_9ACTN|nr:DUF892 family protein [Planosporangium thailandense]NJC72115.1 DUF892 family protein [Planosporangium thailandense]
MAISNPKDLLLYEMSGVLDAEKKTAAWKGEIAGQIRNGNVQQMFRAEQQEGQQRIKNLESCFQALGGRPSDVPCLMVDGVRAEAQQFMSQQPSPECLEMFAVGTMMKLSAYGSGAYAGLVDKATSMGQTQCAQILASNLVMKEESVGRLKRISHEMNQRVMATA